MLLRPLQRPLTVADCLRPKSRRAAVLLNFPKNFAGSSRFTSGLQLIRPEQHISFVRRNAETSLKNFLIR
jgi:hypothetical protein